MAVNQITMAINYRKNKGSNPKSTGKYYAEVGRQKTLSTRGLAEHLKDHNCMVGRDAIMAVLVKLSECIPELVAQGVGVKLDGLGTFYPTIENDKGGATETQMQDKTFNPTSIILGVHVRFQPDGSAIDNLTSRKFLQSSVSPASQNIVERVKRTVNGKLTSIQTLQSLEDFRNPGANAPAQSGDSGSGNENQNANQNQGGDTGGGNTGGGDNGGGGGYTDDSGFSTGG